ADARDESAAADRDQHVLQVGEVLENLEADGALAGDDRGIGKGVDEHAARVCGILAGRDLGDVVRGGAVVERGAQAADALLLRGGSAGGNEDGRADARVPGGEGDRLAVVAGGGGDDAARAVGGRQQRDRVRRAPHLEAAGLLPALQLEVDVVAA